MRQLKYCTGVEMAFCIGQIRPKQLFTVIINCCKSLFREFRGFIRTLFVESSSISRCSTYKVRIFLQNLPLGRNIIIDCSVFVMLTSLLFNVNCYSALVPLAGTNTGAQMYGRSYSMFDIAKR